MKPGDMVFTNFFGEAHKVCLLLEIKKPVVYGRWDRVDPCLVCCRMEGRYGFKGMQS